MASGFVLYSLDDSKSQSVSDRVRRTGVCRDFRIESFCKMKGLWIQIVAAALIVLGIALAVSNSLETFAAYQISGGILALLELISPASLFVCAFLIALVTGANLAARYFKWMVLLRAGHILAPSRRLFFSYLASFIGNLTPFYILYVLRVAPLRERLLPALVILGLDLATDLIAVVALGFAASYALLFSAALVFVVSACALAIFPAKSRDRTIGAASFATSLVFAQSFSLLIWGATGVTLWLVLWFFNVGSPVAVPDAIRIYAAGHADGILSIDLPGFLRVGRSMIAGLIEAGVPTQAAVFAAALVRAFTYWLVILAALVALLFIRRQWRRSLSAPSAERHFDEIAEDYRHNIPEHIRLRLLNRKIELNQKYLPATEFRRGVDAGCGQGWYLKEMLSRGYDVAGVDVSQGQVDQARLYLGATDGERIDRASIMQLPFADGSRDFLYTINTIHHLPDVESQARAFREVHRVLRPGGRFLIHEMNVKNPVFRFYMSYIFPLIKDIDDGTEVWLKATPAGFWHRAGWRLLATEYRTFLPDFVPEFLYRRLWGLEHFLETNRYTNPFSAHVSFVLEKFEKIEKVEPPAGNIQSDASTL